MDYQSNKIIRNGIIGGLSLVALIFVAMIFGLMVNSPETGEQTNPAPSNQAGSTVQSLLASDPGPRASHEQLKAYSLAVWNSTIESSVLDIKGCNPNPPVLHLRTRQSLVIKNPDPVTHRIYHGSGIDLQIPANSEKSYTLKFPNPGIFGYACDGTIPGIFFVTPD